MQVEFLIPNLTFPGPCVETYPYDKSRRDELFLKFISSNTLHVSDYSTAHHQQYLNTVYRLYVFVMVVLLASASVVRMGLHPDHVGVC